MSNSTKQIYRNIKVLNIQLVAVLYKQLLTKTHVCEVANSLK